MSHVVTFYSYKGGVGRTAAAVNAAWLLARAGQRVLLIDGDLEAPGFEEYGELDGPRHPGFLELATEYATSGECPEVTPYVHASRLPNLWVMPAGVVDGSWATRVEALDWTQLHPERGTRPFVERLRARISEALQPDYVFVDARTGFAEVAGVLTHLLPDRVVLLFRQTRTSIRGTLRVFHSLSRGSPPVPVIPVVSLVPPGQWAPGTLGAARVAKAKELLSELGPEEPTLVRIDYDPAAMVAEGIAARSPDIYTTAVTGYRALAERIAAENPADVGQARARAAALQAEGRDGLKYLREHAERYPSASVQAALGDLLLERGLAEEAVDAYTRAIGAGGPAQWHLQRARARLAANDAVGASEDIETASTGAVVLPDATDAEGAETIDMRRRLIALRARAADARGDREAARVALRALRADFASKRDRPGERPSRTQFSAVLALVPPREGFDAGAFWDRLTGSAIVEPRQQVRLLDDLLDGAVPSWELAQFEAVLGAEWRAAVAYEGSAEEAAAAEQDRRAGKADTSVGVLMEQVTRLGAVIGMPSDQWSRRLPTDEALRQQRAALLQLVVERGQGVEEELGEVASALRLLGLQASGDQQRALLERALKLNERALALEADPADLYNTALVLFDLAYVVPERAVELLHRAERYLTTTLAREAEDIGALLLRGQVTMALARKVMDLSSRNVLVHRGLDDLRRARDARPDDADAHLAVADAIALLASPEGHGLPVSMLEEAVAAFERAHELEPGSPRYNWACVLSLLGRLEEAVPHLEAALSNNPELRRDALHDPDLAPLFEARPDLRARVAALAEAPTDT